ncbi:MAG: EutN/CcmL family microcompartment protein [Rubricoccaceae bacterium]|nr:EutN/CcmL family microcompartment protein [Rubricoccaceae bacterium]
MHLARVTGTVVATRKHDRLRLAKLLLVRRTDPAGAPLPDAADEVALDPKFDAGEGDLVLTAKQGAVVQQLLDADLPPEAQRTPANLVIVAVVDGLDVPTAP